MSNSDIFCSHSPWSGVSSSLFILYRWFYAWYILVNRVCHVIVYSFWGKSWPFLCTLVLVDPYGGYYVLPFMSLNHITYIIPHDQLLFFDHSFFHSILFFILSYLSYPWWSSSWVISHTHGGLHPSRWIYRSLKLFLLPWCLWPWEL